MNNNLLEENFFEKIKYYKHDLVVYANGGILDGVVIYLVLRHDKRNLYCLGLTYDANLRYGIMPKIAYVNSPYIHVLRKSCRGWRLRYDPCIIVNRTNIKINRLGAINDATKFEQKYNVDRQYLDNEYIMDKITQAHYDNFPKTLHDVYMGHYLDLIKKVNHTEVEDESDDESDDE